jgi:hypothetical protein
MTAAAAELKTPEPVRAKSPKVSAVHSSSTKHKRRPKKLKTDLVSELAIDVKRPSSVLVDCSVRAILTNIAFTQLSPENQKILIESLPLVDRPTAMSKENQGVDLNPSSINNEFFNRACIEWRDRLSNGEFTNEHQTKLRAEHEREKSKIDPWKAKNFEGIWGIKTNGHSVNVGAMMEKSALEMKDMVEQGDFEIPEGFISEVWKSESVCDEDAEKTDSIDDNWKPSSLSSEFILAETVESNQSEYIDSPGDLIASSRNSPVFEQPNHVEATSSAGTSIAPNDLHEEPPVVEFMSDDVYSNEIANHVELSNEGVPTRWYHQNEHDYLKNVEPVPCEMDEIQTFECDGNEISKEDSNEVQEGIQDEDTFMEDNDRLELVNITRNIKNVSSPRINSYDVELPQEIFNKPEKAPPAVHSSYSNVLLNNFVHHRLVESGTSRYNNIAKEEHNEPMTLNRKSNILVGDNDSGSYYGKR